MDCETGIGLVKPARPRFIHGEEIEVRLAAGRPARVVVEQREADPLKRPELEDRHEVAARAV